jgi:hypothetical protein
MVPRARTARVETLSSDRWRAGRRRPLTCRSGSFVIIPSLSRVDGGGRASDSFKLGRQAQNDVQGGFHPRRDPRQNRRYRVVAGRDETSGPQSGKSTGPTLSYSGLQLVQNPPVSIRDDPNRTPPDQGFSVWTSLLRGCGASYESPALTTELQALSAPTRDFIRLVENLSSIYTAGLPSPIGTDPLVVS